MAESTFPVFVQNGQLTPDGQRLKEFIEAQFVEADQTNNLAKLNALSGPFAEYYTLVHKMHLKTPENWMATMPQSGQNAYEVMKYVEAQALKEAQAVETADKTNEVAANLTALKESLEEEIVALRKEIADLKTQRDAPAGKQPVKRSKKTPTPPDDDEPEGEDGEASAEA